MLKSLNGAVLLLLESWPKPAPKVNSEHGIQLTIPLMLISVYSLPSTEDKYEDKYLSNFIRI
jgi:hypothetical protein